MIKKKILKTGMDDQDRSPNLLLLRSYVQIIICSHSLNKVKLTEFTPLEISCTNDYL